MVAQGALLDTDEQKQLRDTVRRLLRDKSPLSEHRDAEGGASFDRDLWRQLAELGLVALAVPEKYDGLGQTAVETGVVFEELGRALYPGPYLSTVGMVIPALLRSEDESACAELLPSIAAGEMVAALAVAETDGRWDTADINTKAERDGDRWRITGTKDIVLDGADADVLLVAARSADPDDPRVSLFVVNGDAPGLSSTRLESLDLARSVARVSLDGAPAWLVGALGAGPEVLGDVLDRALVGLAAEQAGGAAACLDMSVMYAKTREQFGRPIGSFQAVAHKCVDMLHGVEFSRACARYGAAALAEGTGDAREAARVAAAYCGEAFRAIAVETVQVHGGTGFTWEHDAHLYYRRAWSAQHLLTRPDDHYAAIADLNSL